MVGSSFILTRRPERHTLLNSAQIVWAYTEDIDRSTREGQMRYEDYDPAVTTLYTIQLVLTSRREMEYVFASCAERDALFEGMQKAVYPSVTLDIAEPLIKRIMLPARPKPTADDLTLEELRPLAMAQLKHLQEVAAAAAAPPAAPPVVKPPRKPRAKKGAE